MTLKTDDVAPNGRGVANEREARLLAAAENLQTPFDREYMREHLLARSVADVPEPQHPQPEPEKPHDHELARPGHERACRIGHPGISHDDPCAWKNEPAKQSHLSYPIHGSEYAAQPGEPAGRTTEPPTDGDEHTQDEATLAADFDAAFRQHGSDTEWLARSTTTFARRMFYAGAASAIRHLAAPSPDEREALRAIVKAWAHDHGFITNASPFIEDEAENESQDAIVEDLAARLRVVGRDAEVIAKLDNLPIEICDYVFRETGRADYTVREIAYHIAAALRAGNDGRGSELRERA